MVNNYFFGNMDGKFVDQKAFYGNPVFATGENDFIETCLELVERQRNRLLLLSKDSNIF